MNAVIITVEGHDYVFEAHTWKQVADIIHSQYQIATPENVQVV